MEGGRRGDGAPCAVCLAVCLPLVLAACEGSSTTCPPAGSSTACAPLSASPALPPDAPPDAPPDTPYYCAMLPMPRADGLEPFARRTGGDRNETLVSLTTALPTPPSRSGRHLWLPGRRRRDSGLCMCSAPMPHCYPIPHFYCGCALKFQRLVRNVVASFGSTVGPGEVQHEPGAVEPPVQREVERAER